jgi:hypothetical protein
MRLAIFLLVLVSLFASAQQDRETNYDESRVGELVLPDALAGNAGERIFTAEQWVGQRRPEVLNLFQDHVYGRIQPKPGDLKFEVTATRRDTLEGRATRKLVRVSLTRHPLWKGMDLMLYVPNRAKKRPPVFVGLSFGGNHAVSKETDVPISDRWMRPNSERGIRDNRATPATRGTESSRWPLEVIIERGFVLATAYYGDVEPDHPEGWKEGVRAALSPDGVNTVWKDGDWQAIGAWAWGLSRILDYLQADPDVDAKKAAVIGHSRLGKTALWAGASDERFGVVISNNSGEGGAALMRRNFGETTETITRAFPHWFTPTYRRYANRANACPVDQHMLIALIAPRAVYVASAVEDAWADPKGEFLAAKNAEPVYALFRKGGLGAAAQPAMDHPVGDSIAYHVRAGKHDVTDYDWVQYLKFAARHFGWESLQ